MNSRPVIGFFGAKPFEGAKVRLSMNADGTVKVTAGARVFKSVRLRLGRPLYAPDSFASIMNEKGRELGLIFDLDRMPAASRAVLALAVRRHDLTSRILKVYSLHHQFGAAFWDAETDKGRRQFVIRGTTEHVRWLEDNRMLITDVNGSRFEIKDLSKLDNRSQTLIHLLF